jgi:deazaflavin-dependent oxidoreductase (nitroreductase family)
MSDTDNARSQQMREYQADPTGVNRRIVEEYRANAGHVVQFGGPSRMLLLTTTGTRSGEARTNPMMYLADGDRLVVFASNMGSEQHPGWYHNLVARPEVTVEVGSDRFGATAIVSEGEERERLWRLFPFPQHQEKAHRQIPVVVLERRP